MIDLDSSFKPQLMDEIEDFYSYLLENADFDQAKMLLANVNLPNGKKAQVHLTITTRQSEFCIAYPTPEIIDL